MNNGVWTYTSPDGTHKNCLFTINVFVARPVHHTKESLRRIGYTESSVSRMLRYNNLPCDGSGTSSMMSEIGECLGTSVILTTEDSWEDAMDLLRLRSMTLEQSSTLSNSLFSADASESPGWERFVMFLSTGIRAAMARILENSGSELTVDDSFSMASRYMTVVSNGFRFHSEIPSDTREVLELFGSIERRSA